jgi:glycosyltransferase involved in cell wall biosynthesis
MINFDIEWYLSQYPDVALSDIDPKSHYIKIGRFLGRCSCNPDQSLRIQTKAQLAEENSNDCQYLEASVEIERANSDLITEYSEQEIYRKIRSSGLFDVKFYRDKYADIRTINDPLMHFVIYGAQEGRQPNAYFDTRWYNRCHRLEKKRNPLIEYLRLGWQKGNHPSLAFDADAYATVLKKTTSHDTALQHFLAEGRTLGITPIPLKHSINFVELTRNSDWVPFGDKRLAISSARPLNPQRNFYNPSCLKISFVIPDFHKGAGGHSNIFRIVEMLERSGHAVKLWIVNPSIHQRREDAKEDINKWFSPFYGKIELADGKVPNDEGDILFFTDAFSVYAGIELTNFKLRFYLVQDYETAFFGNGSYSQLCENTYTMGLDCICGGAWLAELMHSHYKLSASYFRFAVDAVYKRSENKTVSATTRVPSKIALYARFSTTRRGVELALMGLRRLQQQGVQFEVHAFGIAEFDSPTPFPMVNHGVLGHEDLSRLYSECDVGLCLSFTNYSIIPNEMMAAGLPVVDIDSPCSRLVYPEGAVSLASPNPDGIAIAIKNLITDNDLRSRQTKIAKDYASNLNWDDELKAVEEAIFGRIQKTPFVRTQSARSKKLVSVIIPTLNAGPLFPKVLSSLRDQTLFDCDVELIVIDSGSSDSTLTTAREFEFRGRVKIISINKENFQHGATRNLGASESQGDLLVFITQDALPANTHWLHHLIAPFDSDERVAGVFSKHLALENSSLFTKRDLANHFLNLERFPIAFSKDIDEQKWNHDISYRQVGHFYSDNASAMRKSVWLNIPYPEVNFGEDQLWARAILEAGYIKYYSKYSHIFHSHEYGESETLKRAIVESSFFKLNFGYELAPRDPKRSLFALNAYDTMWAAQNGVSYHELETRMKNNAATIEGYIQGSSLPKVPNYF